MVATLRVYAFRGLRTVHGKKLDALPHNEQLCLNQMMLDEVLLWSGHVGLSADGGRTIYGFHCVIPDGFSIENVVEHLCAHCSLPGIVVDDTVLFATAAKRARADGWNTAVLVAHRLVASVELQRIQQRLVEMSKITDGSHGYRYALPTPSPDPETGSHFRDERTTNCVGFCEVAFGVALFDKSGSMHSAMRQLASCSDVHGFARLRLAMGRSLHPRHASSKMQRVAHTGVGIAHGATAHAMGSEACDEEASEQAGLRRMASGLASAARKRQLCGVAPELHVIIGDTHEQSFVRCTHPIPANSAAELEAFQRGKAWSVKRALAALAGRRGWGKDVIEWKRRGSAKCESDRATGAYYEAAPAADEGHRDR